MRSLQQPMGASGGSAAAAASRARARCCRRVAAAALPREQQQQQQQPGSAAALTAAAAAVVLQACLPAWPAAAQQPPPPAQQPAAATARRPAPLGELAFAAAAAPELQEEQSAQEIEDEIMADVALPPNLAAFMELTQKGPVKSAKRLSEARRSVGFDRAPDGRVLLFTEDGEPLQVKPDMGVPGALLLRDAGGYLYYIPPADSDSLVQIDLSDDAVVAQLFANHAWEELVEPLEVVSAAQQEQQQSRGAAEQEQPGRLEQLRLTEREFRVVLSLLRGAQALPEEPLEDLASQEAAG